MSIREGENLDFVSVSLGISHGYQEHQQEVISLLPPQNPASDLTATFNCTDNWENDEAEDPIDPKKPSPSTAAQNKTSLI